MSTNTNTNTTAAKATAKLPPETKAAIADLVSFAAEIKTESLAAITKLTEAAAKHAVTITKLANDWHKARIETNPNTKRASAAALHTAMSAAGKLDGVDVAMVSFLLALPSDADDRAALIGQYKNRCASSKPRRVATWPGFVAHVNEASRFAAKYPGESRFTGSGADTAKYKAVKAAADATAETLATTKVTKANVTADIDRRLADKPKARAVAIGKLLNDVQVAFTLAMADLANDAERTEVRSTLRDLVKATAKLAEQADEDEDEDEATAETETETDEVEAAA